MKADRLVLSDIYYGGDFTPEHWPKEVLHEDMRLMKQANVNMVTINVFSWAQLQPAEDTFTFEWLDELMDTLDANGIKADLGTATASPPAWMSVKYPEILPVDERGIRVNYGSRQTFNPSSPQYMELATRLVEKVATRYAKHPALALWHVNNEYSQLVYDDHSESSQAAFRAWLKERYLTLDNLNEAWGTAFWGNLYYDCEHIISPRRTAHQHNSTLVLDWKRFTNDAFLKCALAEIEILRRITPDVPITTNLLYEFKTLDYHQWAQHLDYVSVSSFPDPKPTNHPGEAALSHDIMRGLKDKSFLLLEQAPNNVNWRLSNVSKRPGVMRLWSYQGLAHGADAFLFFQWRASRKGPEKFHSGMVPHSGPDSRTFREVCELGKELVKFKEVLDSDVQADVAIILDYNSWWTVEGACPNYSIKYLEMLQNYHYPLFEQNITTDVIPQDRDLSRYKVVIAPFLYMVKPGFRESVEAFVSNGGIFITTFFSGVVDETEGVFTEGYPGPLSNVLGLKVEEFDALKPYMDVTLNVSQIEGVGETCKGKLWADIVRLKGAEALAVFAEDYYKGMPAITVNSFGAGRAYYLCTQADPAFLKVFLKNVCNLAGVKPVLSDAPGRVEAVVRQSLEGARYLFIMNHNYTAVTVNLNDFGYISLIDGLEVKGSLDIPANGAVVLRNLG